jgi:hypothetical protein
MAGLNGHSNGQHLNGDAGGAKGGVSPKPVRVSAHLQYLQRLVSTGDATAETLEQADKFCRTLLTSDDDGLSIRDRNNAAKTAATIAKLKADIALALHKDDRNDDGKPTDTLKLVYEDEHSVKMAQLHGRG